jgi:hypothetical protein
MFRVHNGRQFLTLLTFHNQKPLDFTRLVINAAVLRNPRMVFWLFLVLVSRDLASWVLACASPYAVIWAHSEFSSMFLGPSGSSL